MVTIFLIAIPFVVFLLMFHLIFVMDAPLGWEWRDMGEAMKCALLSLLLAGLSLIICSFGAVLVSLVTHGAAQEVSHEEYVLDDVTIELHKKSVGFEGTQDGEPASVSVSYGDVKVIDDPSLGKGVRIESVTKQNPYTLNVMCDNSVYVDRNNDTVINSYLAELSGADSLGENG